MSDKNIDWLKRLQLLKNALNENGVNSSLCVELETKINGYELDFTEHDKKFKDEIKQLESELSDVQKSADEYYNKCIDLNNQLAELESELEVKDNLLKIKNGLCKPPMMTVVVAKTINGQDYVRLEDFMSVVNDLQNCHSDHAE